MRRILCWLRGGHTWLPQTAYGYTSASGVNYGTMLGEPRRCDKCRATGHSGGASVAPQIPAPDESGTV